MSAEELEHLDPEWISGTFNIVGHCENPACKQDVHGVEDFSVGLAKESWREEDVWALKRSGGDGLHGPDGPGLPVLATNQLKRHQGVSRVVTHPGL